MNRRGMQGFRRPENKSARMAAKREARKAEKAPAEVS